MFITPILHSTQAFSKGVQRVTFANQIFLSHLLATGNAVFFIHFKARTCKHLLLLKPQLLFIKRLKGTSTVPAASTVCYSKVKSLSLPIRGCF